MPPEFTEIPDRPLTNEEHILTDLHDLLKWAHGFEEFVRAELAEAKELAAPFARIRDAGRLRGLGRGRRDG